MRSAAVTLLVLALLGGTTAAFALTEKLKLERSPITAPRFDRQFSPTCRCPSDVATLRLRFRRRDSVDATVVDTRARPVRTLARDGRMGRGDFTFRWDGRDDAGEVVRDGMYRLQVHLDRQRRTILLPTTIEVDTVAPALELLDARHATFSPDGDGRNDRLELVFRLDEKASVQVFVDGAVAVRGRARTPGRAKLTWSGRVGDAVSRIGAHSVSLQAKDLAGNVSRPTAPLPVRIRYIELTRNVLRVDRGGLLRFRVASDSLPFRWYLFPLRGGELGRPVLFDEGAERNGVVARLPADLRTGRYVLRVGANGHRDRALVHVSRRDR